MDVGAWLLRLLFFGHILFGRNRAWGQVLMSKKKTEARRWENTPHIVVETECNCECRRLTEAEAVIRAMEGIHCNRCGDTGTLWHRERLFRCVGGPLAGELRNRSSVAELGYELWGRLTAYHGSNACHDIRLPMPTKHGVNQDNCVLLYADVIGQ